MRVCGLTISDVDLRVRYIKAVGTVLGWGGGIFYITLTYKKDTILFISIYVISKIH